MMKKNYYNYLLANDKLVKSYYVDETYKKINRMSYKVLQEKHEMFYMLLNIKRLFFYGEKEEMLSFIDKKIKNFQSYNLSQTLNSPLFDYHIMGYINILKDNGYEIKLAIALNNDMLLENIILVKAMKECIKMCVYYCKYDKNFDLHIYDKNTYLMIKLLFKKSKKDFPILQLEKIMHIKRIDFKKKSDDECELGILFEINDKFL